MTDLNAILDKIGQHVHREVMRADIINKKRALEDAVFGVRATKALDRQHFIDFRTAVKQATFLELSEKFENAKGSAAKIIAQELYNRGKMEAIREFSYKINFKALERLDAFNKKYGFK